MVQRTKKPGLVDVPNKKFLLIFGTLLIGTLEKNMQRYLESTNFQLIVPYLQHNINYTYAFKFIDQVELDE